MTIFYDRADARRCALRNRRLAINARPLAFNLLYGIASEKLSPVERAREARRIARRMTDSDNPYMIQLARKRLA